MKLDLLFSALMQADRRALIDQIGRNIAGGSGQPQYAGPGTQGLVSPGAGGVQAPPDGLADQAGAADGSQATLGSQTSQAAGRAATPQTLAGAAQALNASDVDVPLSQGLAAAQAPVSKGVAFAPGFPAGPQATLSTAQELALGLVEGDASEQMPPASANANLLGRGDALPASLSLVGLRAALDIPAGDAGTLAAASTGPGTANPGAATATTPPAFGAPLAEGATQADQAAAEQAAADGDAGPGAQTAKTNLAAAGMLRGAVAPGAEAAAAFARATADAGAEASQVAANAAMRQAAAEADAPTPAARLAEADLRHAPPDRLPAPDRARDRVRAESSIAGADIWGLAATKGEGQTERAGVLSSFILNAAMIPGWPYPKPIELALNRKAVPDPLPMPHSAINEGEAMEYLAKMGAAPGLLSRIREMLSKLMRRARLLVGLAVMMTTLSAALRALQDELELMEEEQEELDEHPELGRRMLVG